MAFAGVVPCDRGLIIIFTGDGKGKTTAAMGTALRMVGRGKKAAMVQFFKTRDSGIKAGDSRFKTWNFGGGCTWEVSRSENSRSVAKAWQKCQELLRSSKYSLVIFDEINIALKYKFLSLAKVIKALKNRHASQHVILTGRGAPSGLIKSADLVTEMCCVKHPFGCGILAKPGLDF